MPLAVFYSFARSGGTLVNRCLGAIAGNLVLSEVNPHGALVPVEVQARDWLGLVGPAEFAWLAEQSYGAKIRRLAESAAARGQHLIIRDWTTLNFLRGLHFDYSGPSMLLEQELYLARYGLTLRAAVIARRAAAVYESITRSFGHFRTLSVEAFGVAYGAYARAVAGQPVFQFERLCADPEAEFRRLCECLGAAYAGSFLTDFSAFDRCTGDNRLSSPSRAGRSKRIEPLAENRDSLAWKAASADSQCRAADEIFGYANLDRSAWGAPVEPAVGSAHSSDDALWTLIESRDRAFANAHEAFRRQITEKQREIDHLADKELEIESLRKILEERDREMRRKEAEIHMLTQAAADRLAIIQQLQASREYKAGTTLLHPWRVLRQKL